MGTRVGLVFAHQGAEEAALFATSVAACRSGFDLHVVGVYGREGLAPLGIEDETIVVRCWHSLSAAWNCGILHALQAGADTILVANDDTVFSPVSLERLLQHLAAGWQCVCPCASEIPALYPWLGEHFPPGAAEAYKVEREARRQGEAPETVFRRWYARWGGFEAFSDWMAEHNRSQLNEPYFHGLAFMGAAALFEEVGLFDVGFKPAYHEDVDYSRRIAALGARSALALDAYFHHWGQATASRKADWVDAAERNAGRIAEKERRGFYSLQP